MTKFNKKFDNQKYIYIYLESHKKIVAAMNIFSRIAHPMQHCERTFLYLAQRLSVKITSTTIQNDLQSHPDYPSLLAFSDVLKNYGVDNAALKLRPEDFFALDPPFVAHISAEKSKYDVFSVVLEVSEQHIVIYNPGSGKNELLSYEEFGKIYKGVVLAIEAGQQAGEEDFKHKKKLEKRKRFYEVVIALMLPTLTLGSIIAAILNSGWENALTPVIFTLLTLAGCLIGVLLLWHEVDEHNPAIIEICHAGKKVNCSAILNSKAAKFLGVSWSVWGSTYFIGLLLSLLTGGIMNSINLFLLGWINVIALPYVVYSIYYQWQIAKQWCLLCLAVQAILLLQFVTTFVGSFHQLHFWNEIPHRAYFTVASSFGFVLIALLLLIPALKKAKDGRDKGISLLRLKHNPQIFDALLAKQKKIENATEGLGITLGSAGARHKLIKVCNPYCGPCARAHPVMEDLLENNEDLQIQIIFTATDNDDDYRAKPVKHLLAIASKGDQELTKKALNDWYKAPIKDYDAFASKYPLGKEPARQTDKIKQMSNWCKETEIAFTPTFFVNGSLMPKLYNLADLKYLLTK
jgi:uncharacterized membrane protein